MIVTLGMCALAPDVALALTSLSTLLSTLMLVLASVTAVVLTFLCPLLTLMLGLALDAAVALASLLPSLLALMRASGAQEPMSSGFGRQAVQSDVRLYLEEAPEDKPLRVIERDELLLFFKLYDPVSQRLSFLGRCFAKKTNKLPDLIPFLNKQAHFPEGTALEVTPGPRQVQPVIVCYNDCHRVMIYLWTVADMPLLMVELCLLPQIGLELSNLAYV